MHRWLAEQLDADDRPARHEAQRASAARRREVDARHAGLPLRAAVEGWEPYIWIVSDTKHQACGHLENIKAELLDNEQLAADYPAGVGRGLDLAAQRDRLRNGVTIEAFGTGQRIRGRDAAARTGPR